VHKAFRFEDVEMNVRQSALRIVAQLLEATLNADTSDYRGPAHTCSCGGIACYRGRRAKTYITVLGEITLLLAYYYCPTCERGFFPRDRQLGLGEGMLPAGVKRMVGSSAALVSFQESHNLLEELAGLNIETKHIERVTEALGKDIAQDECTHRAIQIVDLYHAKGTVSETAKKILGPESRMSEEKAKQWRDHLEAGLIDQIIDELGAYESCQDATTCIKYLQTNRLLGGICQISPDKGKGDIRKEACHYLPGYRIGLVGQHRQHQASINQIMKQFRYTRIGFGISERNLIVAGQGFLRYPVYQGRAIRAGGANALGCKGQLCQPVAPTYQVP
jgi:hypothetical protein